ncbi:MAG: MoxR family ATPase [Alkalinema sp. CAN_BIN05]|nr:MoxR family ATPase [Alkalinema sp. CAN_BIN05]
MNNRNQRKERSKYKFTGDATKRPKDAHPESPSEVEAYVADDDELKQAINLAIYLGRPLLLEGEAGCGKTRLATAIAHELGLVLHRWDIRSTSLAKEGLYEYDALLRLHDVQVAQKDSNNMIDLGRDPSNSEDYLRYGALGKAFDSGDRPAVVLIDEIDKADLDFPNDLLTVLDDPWTFEIPEAGLENGKLKQVGPALNPPIVIITSNREKGYLPLPFLRRCVYYYMKFPDRTGLQKIVEAHYGEAITVSTESTTAKTQLKTDFVNAAIDRFLRLRESGELYKNPGTSEFLDWVDAMMTFGNLTTLLPLLKSLDTKQIPFREVLFKVQKDWQKFDAATIGG